MNEAGRLLEDDPVDEFDPIETENTLEACRKDLEQLLRSRPPNKEAVSYCVETLVGRLNAAASRLILNGEEIKGEGFLAEAAALTSSEAGYIRFDENRKALRANTLSIIACLAKRRGQFEESRRALVEVAELEGTPSANTNLSLANVLVRLEEYSDAVGHASKALSQMKGARRRALEQGITLDSKDASAMVLAFNTLGLSQHHCSQHSVNRAALSTLQEGWHFSMKELGASHATTKAIERTLTLISQQRCSSLPMLSSRTVGNRTHDAGNGTTEQLFQPRPPPPPSTSNGEPIFCRRNLLPVSPKKPATADANLAKTCPTRPPPGELPDIDTRPSSQPQPTIHPKNYCRTPTITQTEIDGVGCSLPAIAPSPSSPTRGKFETLSTRYLEADDPNQGTMRTPPCSPSTQGECTQASPAVPQALQQLASPLNCYPITPFCSPLSDRDKAPFHTPQSLAEHAQKALRDYPQEPCAPAVEINVAGPRRSTCPSVPSNAATRHTSVSTNHPAIGKTALVRKGSSGLSGLHAGNIGSYVEKLRREVEEEERRLSVNVRKQQVTAEMKEEMTPRPHPPPRKEKPEAIPHEDLEHLAFLASLLESKESSLWQLVEFSCGEESSPLKYLMGIEKPESPAPALNSLLGLSREGSEDAPVPRPPPRLRKEGEGRPSHPSARAGQPDTGITTSCGGVVTASSSIYVVSTDTYSEEVDDAWKHLSASNIKDYIAHLKDEIRRAEEGDIVLMRNNAASAVQRSYRVFRSLRESKQRRALMEEQYKDERRNEAASFIQVRARGMMVKRQAQFTMMMKKLVKDEMLEYMRALEENGTAG